MSGPFPDLPHYRVNGPKGPVEQAEAPLDPCNGTRVSAVECESVIHLQGQTHCLFRIHSPSGKCLPPCHSYVIVHGSVPDESRLCRIPKAVAGPPPLELDRGQLGDCRAPVVPRCNRPSGNVGPIIRVILCMHVVLGVLPENEHLIQELLSPLPPYRRGVSNHSGRGDHAIVNPRGHSANPIAQCRVIPLHVIAPYP